MEHYIDYNAILKWIKNVGVNPFPATLRCGRVVYYTAIPNAITLPTPANDDELFWKNYIEFVMGFRDRTTWLEDVHHRIGYGEESKNYTRTYRESRDAAMVELPRKASALADASLLLRAHGQETCKYSVPRCEECVVTAACAWFRRQTR